MRDYGTRHRAWVDGAVRKIEADYTRSADTHLLHVAMPAVPRVALYLKDESTHPTGSLKHRLARSLFLYALVNGWIGPDTVIVETPDGVCTLKNDFVFAMTGYHPDFDFLGSLGIRFEGPDKLPVCNPETHESNIPGIYLAGVIVAGSRTNEIFIENGRFHGLQIAKALASM